MNVGIPKEIKNREGRVAVTPNGVEILTRHGHTVYIETRAGVGSGISDEDFQASGALILNAAEDVWERADMIIKVKEPVEAEFKRIRQGQVIFTYLHLAAEERLTHTLLEKKVTAIAYETIQLDDASLPLLSPMSEVAGRLSIQMGCRCLEAVSGGQGLLLSGVPGVQPGHVVILGGGTAGMNAACIAAGMGARVSILDVNIPRLRYLNDIFGSRATTLMSDPATIRRSIAQADLVVGSVLVPGAKAPRLVSAEHIASMKPGSAFVDIAIDQGGCSETSRPTSHDDPVYIEEGVVHYCVTNMPGAVSRTSTYALTNATLPYALELAEKGWVKAVKSNPALYRGLNSTNGAVTNPRVAEAFGLECSTYS